MDEFKVDLRRGVQDEINDSQLSFEMYGRMVEARRSLFDPNTESLKQELVGVSEYLRRVLLEWQTDTTVVGRGADASSLVGWKHFGEFVGYDDESRQAFTASVAEPLARIELLLASSALPPNAGRSA